MAEVLCPRCDSNNTRVVTESSGYWTVFACNRCNYLWRSTEKLDGIAKLTEQQIKSAPRLRYWPGDKEV